MDLAQQNENNKQYTGILLKIRTMHILKASARD